MTEGESGWVSVSMSICQSLEAGNDRWEVRVIDGRQSVRDRWQKKAQKKEADGKKQRVKKSGEVKEKDPTNSWRL